MTKPPPDEAAVHGEGVSLPDARLMADELPDGRWTKDEAARDLYLWLKEEALVFTAALPISAIMERNEARVRSGLKAVVKSDPLRTSLARLTNASEGVRRQIQIAYAEGIPEGKREDRDAAGRRQYERDLAGAKRLADAVDAAQQRVSSKGGRRRLVNPHIGAERLKKKFEGMSGFRFTFDREKGRKGLGWVTPGARFVAAGLQAWFPNITDAQLDTAMKYLRGNKDLPKPPPK